MTYPDIRLVDAPSASAATLLDFNDTTATPYRDVVDDFSPGSPSPDGEPDSIDPLYGNREVSFTFRIKGTKAQAATLLNTLSRRLLAGPGWLRWQLTASDIVKYYRILRANPGDVSMENITSLSTTKAEWWSIAVSLPCEDFSYGERETMSAITISNDPTSGTNRCRAVLPTVLGDAPTALRIQMNPSTSNVLSGYRHMFSVQSSNSSVAGPIVWPVGGTDGWTAGTDTAASSTDAAAPGGNKRVVSFATNATMATRLSGNAPASLPAGKYKILVWVSRSDTSSTFAMRLGQSRAGSFYYGDTAVMDRAASTATGHSTWVELGEFQHPFGHVAPAGFEGFAFAPSIAFQAQRLSGAGTMSVAGFLLIPVDSNDTIQSRTLYAEFNLFGIDVNGGTGTFDGDNEVVWTINQFGFAGNGTTPELQGSFPVAVPGAVNTLHMLQQVNGRVPAFSVDNPDSVSATSVLTISYHPRYL